MHPKDLEIKDFTYPLPTSKIALHPLPIRDQSKLLIWKDGNISESCYREIADFLPQGCTVVLNDTKVIPARILFIKPTGGVIEIFCLEPCDPGPYQILMHQKQRVRWKCMIGGAGKWKSGDLQKSFTIKGITIALTVRLIEKLEDSYITEFSWEPSDYSFLEMIQAAGNIPLPPYIKRNIIDDDKLRYQTVYANAEGSVAAPTAGLHFTPQIIDSFIEKNINIQTITLHVGAGTFKPVKAERMSGHTMHAEMMEITIESVQNLIENRANIIAVGTTSLRTLESLYWMGVKCLNNPGISIYELNVQQWEVYEKPLVCMNIDVKIALEALSGWMISRKLDHLFSMTSILIAPGYTFRMVKALVTNFHQPQSTLLLLIAAIAGIDGERSMIMLLKMNSDF